VMFMGTSWPIFSRALSAAAHFVHPGDSMKITSAGTDEEADDAADTDGSALVFHSAWLEEAGAITYRDKTARSIRAGMARIGPLIGEKGYKSLFHAGPKNKNNPGDGAHPSNPCQPTRLDFGLIFTRPSRTSARVYRPHLTRWRQIPPRRHPRPPAQWSRDSRRCSSQPPS